MRSVPVAFNLPEELSALHVVVGRAALLPIDVNNVVLVLLVIILLIINAYLLVIFIRISLA
jgi:hypothetical protein